MGLLLQGILSFMIMSIYTYCKVSMNSENVCVGKDKNKHWSGAELSA